MIRLLAIVGVMLPVAAASAAAAIDDAAIERVSLSVDGGDPLGDSTRPSTSADGRFVAFSSAASDLVADDSNNICDNNGDGVPGENCGDVFVVDRATGQTDKISSAEGGGDANSASGSATISADGRFVAFLSWASNIAKDSDGAFGPKLDAFVHDRDTGLTELVSVDNEGVSAIDHITDVAMSPNGRFVAFSTYDSLSSGDTNGTGDVYVRDLESRATALASVQNGQAMGGPSTGPSVDDNGDVAFFLFANLPPFDPGAINGLYIFDALQGAAAVVPAPGVAVTHGSFPSISGDGRHVAFLGGTQGRGDLFVHDRETKTLEPVSFNEHGEAANGPVSIALNTAVAPAISYDGRFIAYSAKADNIVAGDSNGCIDVFVHDAAQKRTALITVGAGGEVSDGSSGFVALSANGNMVAFDSVARNLTLTDANGDSDVFVRELDKSVWSADNDGGGQGCHVAVGDADCDGELTSADALQVMRYVAALRPWGECVRVTGNVNCDPFIDALDPLAILRAIAGLGVIRSPEDCFR